MDSSLRRFAVAAVCCLPTLGCYPTPEAPSFRPLAVRADPAPNEAASTPEAVSGPIEVGIEGITIDQDRTDGAFDLTNYLSRNPIAIGGDPINVRLIDFPLDTEYAVAGRVNGRVTFGDGWDNTNRRSYRGYQKYVSFGIAVGMIDAVADHSKNRPLILSFSFAIAATGLMESAMAAHDEHLYESRFTHSLVGNFTVRRDGKVRDTFAVSVDGDSKIPLETQSNELRARVYEPLWRAVRDRLSELISADHRTIGAKP